MTTKKTLQELKDDISSEFNTHTITTLDYTIIMNNDVGHYEGGEIDKLAFKDNITGKRFMAAEIFYASNINRRNPITFSYKIQGQDNFTSITGTINEDIDWDKSDDFREEHDDDEDAEDFEYIAEINENWFTVGGVSIMSELHDNVNKKVEIKIISHND